MTLLILSYLLNLVMGLPRAGLPRVLTFYVGVSGALMTVAELFVFGTGKCLTDLISGWMSDCTPGGRKTVLLFGGTLTMLGCASIYLAVPGGVSSRQLDDLVRAQEAAKAAGVSWQPPVHWGAFALIALGQFLNGLGVGFQNQGIMVAMQDLGGRARRGLAGGLFEAAIYWGVTAGTFMGGWLVSVSGQLLFPFLVMTGIAFLCVLVAAAGTVDTRKAILEPAGFTPQPLSWDAYRTAFTHRSLYVVYFAGLMSKWVDSLIFVMSSLYLRHLNYSVAQTAVIQTGFVLSWSTLSLFTGGLSDFIGRKWLIGCGMLWSGVFTLVLLFGSRPDNLGWQLLLTVLLGCGTGLYYGLPPAIVADVAPVAYRGVCISVYRFWRDFGHIAAALVIMGCYRLWGETIVAAERIMLVSALLLLAGAAVAFRFMRETWPGHEPPPDPQRAEGG
jgi:MFS family permease